MNHFKTIVPYLGVALVTVLLIYLTPLKNLNLVEPTIKDVDPKEFYTDFTANPDKYMFIDVRSDTSYNKLHAVGSMNIELHAMYDAKYVLPKKGKTIALICSEGRASGVAYGYLEHYGFLNLVRIKGGIENWQAQGLPIEGTSVVTTVAADVAEKISLLGEIIPCT